MGGIALSAFALLVPLTMWLGFADGVEFPKHLTLRLLALVLALAVIFRPESRPVLAAHPLAVPLTLLSLFALASTVFCGAPFVAWSGEEGSWKGSSALASVWLGALFAGTLAQGRMARKWAVAVLVSAGLVLIYGFIQVMGVDPVPWDPGKRTTYWIMATLGNPVHLGNFLVCAFLLSLSFMPARSVPARIFRGLVLAGILATLSRSALLSLLVGMAVWLAMRRNTGLRSGGAAMVMPAVAVLPFLGSLERLFSLTRLAGARPQMWEGASRISAHHPLLGAGPDLFYSVFPAFAGYGFYSAEPPSVIGETVFLRFPASAHSELLDTASMLGLPALGFYIWALVVVVRKCRNSPFLPALAALWIGHQINPSSIATSALFWTMAVVACRPSPSPAVRGRGGVLFPGILSVVLLASLVSAMRVAEAQAYRRESGRLLFIGDQAGAMALQDRWGRAAARAHPRQALDDASILSRIPGDGSADRARAMLELARARNPLNLFYLSASAELDYTEGRRLRDRKLLEASGEGFRRALALTPSVISLHDDLARVLDAQGRKREAEAERSLRRGFDPLGLFAPRPATGPVEK